MAGDGRLLATAMTGPSDVASRMALRALADQALARAAGASLITGNSVRLLKDARENYPAWLDAIAGARRWIHFESYIIHDDDVGEQFAAALIARAREAVPVRVIYDWMGGFGKTSRRFWNRLRAAGIEVRCHNPPRLGSPLGWLSRDHRKMLSVDGAVGFVTGLCIGRAWVGDPSRGVPPWRDTGVEVRGPAVGLIEQAFRQMWALSGTPTADDGVAMHPRATASDVRSNRRDCPKYGGAVSDGSARRRAGARASLAY